MWHHDSILSVTKGHFLGHPVFQKPCQYIVCDQGTSFRDTLYFRNHASILSVDKGHLFGTPYNSETMPVYCLWPRWANCRDAIASKKMLWLTDGRMDGHKKNSQSLNGYNSVKNGLVSFDIVSSWTCQNCPWNLNLTKICMYELLEKNWTLELND